MALAQPAATLQFAASSYTVAGNAGTVTLSVQRTGDANAALTVDYATADGTVLLGVVRVDDAGYLRGLIEEIGRRFAVDSRRVYLFGAWIGGAMAYRMAGDCPDRLAAIAAWSGTTFLDPDRCHPAEPVNVLHVHTTGDDGFPYWGGTLNTTFFGFPANTPPLPGAERNVQTWARHYAETETVNEGVTLFRRAPDEPLGAQRQVVVTRRIFARTSPFASTVQRQTMWRKRSGAFPWPMSRNV